ncbi:hypothetical protein PPERSA_04624 [Pseudocohnilembus persalinus]|uniref:DUF4200 domain-containing protein n=1 Tax=Pseudocohnilembus persalinus TaxID=266149 RepID=A0A0V0QPA1_PSEPJ|nr:hypothetical protein PPERSA_04624 [Pseudocohnilembus persalinus]|eukprot:KRX03829.1 hypothetical protein PPERSA_04624 [Pseudocohnilembus persalinus]
MLHKIKANKLPSHIQFDTVSPATKLLEKRRKMYEVNEAFESQKEEFKKKEKVFQEHEESIRQRDWQIQDNLIEYCKFLQENDAKRERARKRFNDEQKARIQKEEEIAQIKQQCEELNNYQTKLNLKVTSLKKYEAFLEQVIKQFPDQYTDLSDILSRYRILTNSNQNLQFEHNEKEKEYEKLKKDSIDFEKEQNQYILHLNNEIKELSKRLEEKEHERNNLQQQVEASSNENTSKNLTLGRILIAIDNLYDNRLEKGSYTQKIKLGLPEEIKQISNKDQKDNIKQEKDKDKRRFLKDKILREWKYGVQKEIPEDDYNLRTKQAIYKLKMIAQSINDIKNILSSIKEEYKKTKN